MTFEQLLEELLTEASPIDIYNKYYSHIPPITFIRIISSDPQTEIIPGREPDISKRVKRIGKYSKLLLSLYDKSGLKLEDLDRANEYLSIIYKHNISVDINKPKQLSDLYDLVSKYIIQEKKDLGTILQTLSSDEYKILHNGKNWYVIQPLTEKSSCYLGISTDWCTAWGPYSLNPSYRERSNHFSKHNRQGPLFIIINKSNETSKYQFHFETKQFMDPSDRQIDTGHFLDKNPEIKYFFFPSLIKNIDDQKIIDTQSNRIFVLNNKDSFEFLKKTISEDSLSNQLVYDLVNNNIDGVMEKIKDKDLISDVFLTKEQEISFNFKSVKGTSIEDVQSVISSYEHDAEEAYDRIYRDVNDRLYDKDDKINSFEPFFKKYYEKNNIRLKSELGIFSYEELKKRYFELFYEDEKIQSTYAEKTAEINEEHYSASANNAVNDIKKYINISYLSYSGYEIDIPIVQFIKYILKNNIQNIEDNLLDVIDNYIQQNNVQTEYEYIDDYYNLSSPKWEQMENSVEEFFDKIFEDVEGSERCVELRNKFNDVIRTVFNGNNFFENEHVIVKIMSGVDCETESVNIYFNNKDTGKIYTGNVKVENLASYATNYQLFEQFINFKKNIL